MLLEDVWFDIIAVVFKELAQKRLDEFVLRSRQLGKEAGLKPKGKPHLDRMIADYKNGQVIEFWRYTNMLDGYDYTSKIYGLENLESTNNQPTLIIANHPYGGPLRGHGQRFVLNHYVHKTTGKETRWLFGLDKTTPERFTRKRFVNQSSLIPVRDDDPKTSNKLILQALRNKDTIGINPEGDSNKTLLKAVPKATRMIILSARHNYNIVCVATDFKNGAFFMSADPPLDNERIKETRRILNDKKDELNQLVSDYVMSRIAQHLPEEKRGYYTNFQKFIDAFAALTSTA